MLNTIAPVPTIDVGALVGGSTGDVIAVAKKIGAAAREIGFFSIVNHGISRQRTRAVFEAARVFFESSASVKEGVSIERSPIYRGYSRYGYEKFDPAHPADAKESFDIGPDFAPDHPSVLAREPFRDVNLWPELSALPTFRETLVGYWHTLMGLAVNVHRAIALDLGAEERFFEKFYDRPLGVLRLLRYPPHPGTFDGGLHGAAPHTDFGILSLLAQDDAGGLEVRTRDGAWLPVQPNPDAFVCNIGDCLMRWSNDAYISTLHRVVNLSRRERYSVVLFGDPDPDTPIACLPSCISAENPPKYPPIEYRNYLQSRLLSSYTQDSST